jgi:hypothetical protein
MNKAEQLAEERYPYYRRPMVVEYTANKHADELRAAFIAGYEADKWIRVEGELPDYENIVNGYFPDGDEGGRKVAEAVRSGDSVISAFPNSTASWFKATHWQPLPSPPKTK